jgi:sigma-E factor negative regulatory protein RseA
MTDTLKEQLSAFLDGELPEAETTLLLKRLERDDDLRGTLSRYSLIGAVLRTDGDVPAARFVAARVSAAIAREPSPGRVGRSRWLRPAAGLAVAASVAMATILLLPQWLGGEVDTVIVASADDVAAGTPVQAELVQAGQVIPVVAATDEPARTYTTPQAPAESSMTLSSAQLASYLVAHSEYTSPLSRSSLVSGATAGEATRPAASADREGSN